MSKLLLIGHGSLRFTTNDRRVIFVDPFIGEGYDRPADVILVTHQHFDHNQVQKVAQKQGCIVITQAEALQDGVYNTFDIDGIIIKAVPAGNKNHPINSCVGYVIEFDGLKVYCAGDTSRLDSMKELAGMNLDYALLPIDGFYNMGPEEAARCAEDIKARHTIPIHITPTGGQGEPKLIYDEEKVGKFVCNGKLAVRYGEEIEL